MANNARPANPCTTPGCRGRAEKGRCILCRQRQARSAPSTGPRYGGTWGERRIRYLRENPYCIICTHLAHVPDHYPLSRRALIDMGVHDPDADEYLRPLCKRCHDKQTAIHQPGGWHRDRTRWNR